MEKRWSLNSTQQRQTKELSLLSRNNTPTDLLGKKRHTCKREKGGVCDIADGNGRVHEIREYWDCSSAENSCCVPCQGCSFQKSGNQILVSTHSCSILFLPTCQLVYSVSGVSMHRLYKWQLAENMLVFIMPSGSPIEFSLFK